MDILVALLAAVGGGLVAHFLTLRREWQREQRGRLWEFSKQVNRADTIGLNLAWALERGDYPEIQRLSTELSGELIPLLMYGTVFGYFTTELRNAVSELGNSLAVVRRFAADPVEAAEKFDPEGALHYWRAHSDNEKLLDGFKLEFAKMI